MGDTDAALSPDATIAVLGAGTMGRGIARVAAEAGHRVLLHDARRETTDDAIVEVRSRLTRDAERDRISAVDADAIADRITIAESLSDVVRAALIIEAIVERIEAKHELFRALDEVAPAATVFATNTSSLSVEAIATATRRPARFAGLHFFNPAPVMPLVEVAAAPDTDEATVETLVATMRRWGKTPVRCLDSPGFIVNRVARPFYLEALEMLEAGGVQPARLDAGFRAAGFRMGPCELLDLIGLDVNLAVSESVHTRLGDEPRIAPSPLQRRMVATGDLGRKTGAGFYAYPEGRPSVAPHPPGRFDELRIVGQLGHGEGLAERLAAAHDVTRERASDDRPGIVVDGVTVEPAPGDTDAAAVFDVVADWSRATAVAASGDDATMAAFAAACAGAGVEMIRMPPSAVPVVLRTVTMLVTVAIEAATAGVAEPSAIDTAMRLGVNHPLGPFEWRELLGDDAMAVALERLAGGGDPLRYRPVGT